MPRHIHICIYTFEHLYVSLPCWPKTMSEHQFACCGIQNSPGGDTSRTTTIILVLIVSRCPVSYRTSLINPLLQRFSSLVASKSPFQYQGRKYPSWHCCHSHGPMTPVDFRASRNFKLGTSEWKGLARPKTELLGDLFRSRQCREGSILYSKVHTTGPVLQEGRKEYHTHLLFPLLRTAVIALWGGYNTWAGAETLVPVA